jgi:hypothetical protein
MSTIKVSSLAAKTSLSGSEEALINDGGTSKKVTVTNLIAGALPKSGGAMTGAITTNSTFDGRDVAADGATADAALPKAGGAMTGAITTNSTFDGVDIATRDAVLTSTTTTANAALPKAGGAMTGPITTNSTFDGVDIATRDGVLTSTTTTANAALPKAGGAMTGAITTNSTFDGVDVASRDAVLTSTTTTANAALPKAGGTMTGDINMGANEIKLSDGGELHFGTGADLKIYHDGGNSQIRDLGTGDLILQGSTDIRLQGTNDENMAVFGANSAVYLYHDNSLKFDTQSGGVGITGTLTASGNVTAYSDERLKDDIQVIPNALSKVEEIRGVTFTRNDLETDERFSGVIAQEVEAVLPEVIHEAEDGMKTVDYGNMVGLLIEGMKEQQEIIRSLAARIEELEAR